MANDDELDLETGDSSRADPATERNARRRRRGTSGSSSSSSSTGARAEAKVETEIRSRLDRVFDRIAKAREARGDDELVEAIREDSDAMAQGFISLTSNIVPLRVPLLMLLNLLEPLLAFGRVGRILAGRLLTRRERRQAEREQAAAEQAAQEAGYAEPGLQPVA